MPEVANIVGITTCSAQPMQSLPTAMSPGMCPSFPFPNYKLGFESEFRSPAKSEEECKTNISGVLRSQENPKYLFSTTFGVMVRVG